MDGGGGFGGLAVLGVEADLYTRDASSDNAVNNRSV